MPEREQQNESLLQKTMTNPEEAQVFKDDYVSQLQGDKGKFIVINADTVNLGDAKINGNGNGKRY